MRNRAALGWMLGITAATVGALVWWPREVATSVRAAPVQYGGIEARVDGSGTVGHAGEIRVSSLSGGLVAEVYVTPGTPVQGGTPLFRLDATAQQQAYTAALQAAGQQRVVADDAQAAWGDSAQALLTAQLAQSDAQAGQLARAVAAMTVRATDDGQVLETYVTAGEVLLPGAPALRMAQAAQRIQMQLGERESLRVQPGQRARLLRDDVFLGEATVLSVGIPTARADGVLAAAVELVPDAAVALPTGARLDVEIVCQTQSQSVLVPLEALDENQQQVWLVYEGRAFQRPVRIGLQDERHAAVQGVSADACVILDPPAGLSEGTLVQVVGSR